jgi:hypothetical protein
VLPARSRAALEEVATPRVDRLRLDLWTLRFEGRKSSLRDVVGLHYLEP